MNYTPLYGTHARSNPENDLTEDELTQILIDEGLADGQLSDERVEELFADVDFEDDQDDIDLGTEELVETLNLEGDETAVAGADDPVTASASASGLVIGGVILGGIALAAHHAYKNLR